ncbi:DUF4350 domain-containing protein [uncultured Erythrobacter sp.]|uniref:DUF4350 domain-containing protein n=1 Tax=uncultured Erythrobacter sp. TaxID=263913 RepID=UPI00260B2678|nr:DUF4350 domain-containing protein [uncultured Erythrobacter sp.]
MSEALAPPSQGSAVRTASPFTRGSVLAILVVGFSAFVAMLYFLGAGDTGGESANRNAHASSNALHGFAGLTRLLEANGYNVEKSRERSGLETPDLLILTPTRSTNPDDFAEILESRQYQGPTLVILPKWIAARPQGEVAEEDEERVQDDWVQLISPYSPEWAGELPELYSMNLSVEFKEQPARWGGMRFAGQLPMNSILSSEHNPNHEALVIDDNGRRLALNVIGQEGTYFYDEAHWLTIVVEPDLMNNHGLADPARAALALALIEQAGYDEKRVTFDLTMVGIGGATNLLTLAFRPPFLAATLCLILATLIVGWRAFLRFGPVVAQSQEARFGKTQLVTNGAGLIVRAGRLQLLAEPFANLAQRKVARTLGLSNPDADAIDAALAQRLPDEEPFSNRVDKLKSASRAGEVLRAAQNLNNLASKVTGISRR